MFKRAILFLVLVPLAGCISIPEMVQRAKIKNMKGKPIDAALAEFGHPTKIYDSQFGKVYEWSWYYENTVNQLLDATVAPGPNGAIVYQTYGDVIYPHKCVMKVLVIPSTQLIDDYFIEGNDCKAW